MFGASPELASVMEFGFYQLCHTFHTDVQIRYRNRMCHERLGYETCPLVWRLIWTPQAWSLLSVCSLLSFFSGGMPKLSCLWNFTNFQNGFVVPFKSLGYKLTDILRSRSLLLLCCVFLKSLKGSHVIWTFLSCTVFFGRPIVQELIRRWDSERELLRSTSGRYPNSLK